MWEGERVERTYFSNHINCMIAYIVIAALGKLKQESYTPWGSSKARQLSGQPLQEEAKVRLTAP